jgi:hypothetical protein
MPEAQENERLCTSVPRTLLCCRGCEEKLSLFVCGCHDQFYERRQFFAAHGRRNETSFRWLPSDLMLLYDEFDSTQFDEFRRL